MVTNNKNPADNADGPAGQRPGKQRLQKQFDYSLDQHDFMPSQLQVSNQLN